MYPRLTLLTTLPTLLFPVLILMLPLSTLLTLLTQATLPVLTEAILLTVATLSTLPTLLSHVGYPTNPAYLATHASVHALSQSPFLPLLTLLIADELAK